MRARLLDMGEVAPVRSQSFYRAIAGPTGSADLPVLVLLQLASPLVLLGHGSELKAAEIEACRDRRIPALPWPGRSVRRLGAGEIVFQLVVARSLAADLGLPPMRERRANLAAIVARACRGAGLPAAVAKDGQVEVDGREVSRVEACEVDDCAVMLGDLEVSHFAAWGVDLSELAESLVAAFEKWLGLGFEPSMPTPPEMEAIYDEDRELARAERTGLSVATGSPA